jgi:hypothetical protein
MLVVALWSVLLGGSVAQAANHPRLVEAWAEAPVDIHAPMRITPRSAEQAKDPVYVAIANELGALLASRGFNLVDHGSDAQVYLLVDYVAYTKPFGSFADAPLADRVYRALVVTALDAHSIHPGDPPHVLWQTVVDSGGFSADVKTIIPALVHYGGGFYGQALTPRGMGPARWCANADGYTGTLIKPNCPAQPQAPPPPPVAPVF